MNAIMLILLVIIIFGGGIVVGFCFQFDKEKYMIVLKDNNNIKYFSEFKDVKLFINSLEYSEEYSLYMKENSDYIFLTSNLGQ